ncbi:MAG TPA: hypothetical protein VM735_09695, partial [Candidatus Kapabacteria bacterium]|nr:hypothetical protein [Candidatus Kapabacteria bacterium]
TVDAPPTFSWTGSGPANPKIYISNKPAPIIGTDTIVFLDNPNGSTSFTPSRTNWITAVNTLGVAQNYYWTLGSGNASAREVYADWIPFKTRSFASGATIAAPTGEFRFTIIAPNQAQVVIQASDALTNWADIATVQNTSGTVTHNDSLSQPKRFYRAKP